MVEGILKAFTFLQLLTDPVRYWSSLRLYGAVVWDGDTQSVLGVPSDRISTTRKWMERVHPDDRIRLKGLRQLLMSGERDPMTLDQGHPHAADGAGERQARPLGGRGAGRRPSFDHFSRTRRPASNDGMQFNLGNPQALSRPVP